MDRRTFIQTTCAAAGALTFTDVTASGADRREPAREGVSESAGGCRPVDRLPLDRRRGDQGRHHRRHGRHRGERHQDRQLVLLRRDGADQRGGHPDAGLPDARVVGLRRTPDERGQAAEPHRRAARVFELGTGGFRRDHAGALAAAARLEREGRPGRTAVHGILPKPRRRLARAHRSRGRERAAPAGPRRLPQRGGGAARRSRPRGAATIATSRCWRSPSPAGGARPASRGTPRSRPVFRSRTSPRSPIRTTTSASSPRTRPGGSSSRSTGRSRSAR